MRYTVGCNYNIQNQTQSRANHSKDLGKGLARPAQTLNFKINLCRSDIKNKVGYKKSEIKIFVRKEKLKPPHGGGFPKDDPIQGGVRLK